VVMARVVVVVVVMALPAALPSSFGRDDAMRVDGWQWWRGGAPNLFSG
jgi:hypothetical protein